MLCMYGYVRERCELSAMMMMPQADWIFFFRLFPNPPSSRKVASNLIRSKSTDLHSFFPPLRRLPFILHRKRGTDLSPDKLLFSFSSCPSIFLFPYRTHEHTHTNLLWPLHIYFLLISLKKYIWSNVIIICLCAQ